MIGISTHYEVAIFSSGRKVKLQDTGVVNSDLTKEPFMEFFEIMALEESRSRREFTLN